MEKLKNTIINDGRKAFETSINSMERAMNSLGEGFASAVQMIAGARKVVLTGVGKSGLVARKISATFSSIGVPSIFLHPVEALHGDIGIVERNDVVIMLSKSGTTDELIRLIPFLRARQVKIISILGNINSFISRQSDVTLNGYVEVEACPLNIAPTSSTIVAMAIGDALAVCTMRFNKTTVEDFSRQHPLGQIGRNITLQVKDVMHSGEDLPAAALGTGFRSAIITMSKHALGCVCVIDDDGKLCGLITDGDLRRALERHDDIRDLTVDMVMTKNPVRTSPEALLGEALSTMEQRPSQISVLPVVDKHSTCLGVIRLHDIARSGM